MTPSFGGLQFDTRIRGELRVWSERERVCNVALPFMLKSHPSMRRRPDNRFRMHRQNNNNPGIHTLHSNTPTPHHTTHIVSNPKLRPQEKNNSLFNLFFLFFNSQTSQSLLNGYCIRRPRRLQMISRDQGSDTLHQLSCESPPFACRRAQGQTIHYSVTRFVAIDFKLGAT